MHHFHFRNAFIADVEDARELSAVADVFRDRRAQEAVPDLVHAAHRLEERRLPLVLLGLIEAIVPEVRADQVRKLERLEERAAFFDAGIDHIAGA
jgi:hypothetical protein